MPISDIFFGNKAKEKEEKEKELQMCASYSQLANSNAWKYLKKQLQIEQESLFSAFRDSKFANMQEVENLQVEVKARDLIIRIVEDNARKFETLSQKSAGSGLKPTED